MEWPTRDRYRAGLGLLAVLGWFAFVRGVRVPLLGWIDLFIHEAGHVFGAPLPDLGEAAAGSAFQVLVPLGLAAAFWWRERDPLGAAVCLGWAGTSLQDAHVYIADAPYQRLPLIGGHHDWAGVLGPGGLDALDRADDLARVALAAGYLAWAAGVAACLWALANGVPRGWSPKRAAPPAATYRPLRVTSFDPPAAAAGPAADDEPAAARPPRPDHEDDGDADAAREPHA